MGWWMANNQRREFNGVTMSDKGIALPISLMVLLLLSIQGLTFLILSATESTITSNKINRAQAFAITEAGIEHARRELLTANVNAILAGNPPLVSFTAGGQNVSFAGGTYSVTVRNNTTAIGAIPADPGGPNNDTDDILVLTSTGSLGNATSSIEAIVQGPLLNAPGATGAVTANGPIKTNGSITIDGRDHDMNGNLIADTGTYGIFTASTYLQGGSSKVGGTEHPDDQTSLDHAPAKPGDPSVIVENYSGPMATTPDEVMGYSANGTLKSKAQSGVNGSQYVTDPANLTFPLSGVTYVELPPGVVWNPVNLADSTGILVVHNSAGNAVIKNINPSGPSCGCFRGLIIADDIVHIHTKIIGAIVSLTPGPSMGNVIGNGNGQVLYSSEALANAIEGIAPQSYTILSWREVGN